MINQLDLTGLNPEFEARPYQLRIVGSALKYIDEGVRTLMIESPTGSGKSSMGLLLAREFERRGWSSGWCAMRSNLLRQVERENERWGFNVKDFQAISMFDKRPPKRHVLFVDEAQHDSTASMNHIHQESGAEIIIGLSATPYRPDRVGLCFQKVIRDIGINQLIREGYLSKYDHYTVPAFNPGVVAETYLRDRERWGKSIVFFHTQAECDELERLLKKGGVACEVVNSSTDRERQIMDLESGKLQVLINMLILTEGFDCPSLKTAFIRDSSKGPTIQMGGRVFRKFEGIAAKQIVQSKQTRYPFQKTAVPREQYAWESDSWRSITMNGRVEQVSRNTALMLAQQSMPTPAQVAAATIAARQEARERRVRSRWRRDE